MKHEKMKAVLCAALAGCLVLGTVMVSHAQDAEAQTKTQGILERLGEKPVLNDITEELPEAASVAVETQEWHEKALANTEEEMPVYKSADGRTEVVGKVYKNTIVDIEENGETWSKVSSGDVVGYIQNENLSFGTEAVERAKTVCPAKAEVEGEEYLVVETDGETVTLQNGEEQTLQMAHSEVTITRDTKDAKSMEQILKEEAEKKAAEEAAKKEAEKKAAEEAAKKEAEKKAVEEKVAEEKAERAASSQAVLVSAGDRELLAAIIYCEAGAEPYEGKVAVGAVIMNRVRSSRFPDTISEVIYQKGQFGPAVTGKLGRVLAAGKATSECYQAADAALAGENPVGSALFFGNGNSGQKIGGHYFH